MITIRLSANHAMTKSGFIRSLRARALSLRFRFLKRVHRPGRRPIWQFNRTSVARGVAIGLFCGVMIPVAQIVLATLISVAARANVLVAAVSTLVTNPVTLPFVYYCAYRIGSQLTTREVELAEDVAASEEAAAQALEVASWLDTLLSWMASMAVPFLTGLTVLAIAVALFGYLCVHAAWAVRETVNMRRGG